MMRLNNTVFLKASLFKYLTTYKKIPQLRACRCILPKNIYSRNVMDKLYYSNVHLTRLSTEPRFKQYKYMHTGVESKLSIRGRSQIDVS